jgi:hypothetical protein
MATNTLAPNGLSVARNFISGANTYQANQFTIKRAYATSIGMGDVVATGTVANLGYVTLANDAATKILGIFAGVLPYYDATLQGISHGLNGAYQSTSNPNADISCLVYSDPYTTFIAQVVGSTGFSQSWVGQNIGWTAATNGAANSAGRSTLSLAFSSLGTTPTLPFRIVGPAGITGGPQDPANVNPWVEVRINTSEVVSATGV